MSADGIIKRTNLLFWEDGGTDSKKKFLQLMMQFTWPGPGGFG